MRGIYRGKDPTVDTRVMAFDYRCLNERLGAERKDRVGFFTVRVDDPSRSTAVATAIDTMFQNSPYETKTESERAFQLGFVAMSGAILAAVRIVSYVILVIMLLVVSNTIAMGVRERTVDFSTLRALGFRPKYLVALVLGESTTIGLLGAAFGVTLSPLIVRAFGRIVSASFGSFPVPHIRADTIVFSAVMALLVGIVAGALPALHAARLPVAEGLHREIGWIPLYYNYRSLFARRLSTGATVIGLALVVFTFAAVLMLSNGIESALRSGGRRDNVVLLREGATSEIVSAIESRCGPRHVDVSRGWLGTRWDAARRRRARAAHRARSRAGRVHQRVRAWCEYQELPRTAFGRDCRKGVHHGRERTRSPSATRSSDAPQELSWAVSCRSPTRAGQSSGGCAPKEPRMNPRSGRMSIASPKLSIAWATPLPPSG